MLAERVRGWANIKPALGYGEYDPDITYRDFSRKCAQAL